jgi:hypothetical protein
LGASLPLAIFAIKGLYRLSLFKKGTMNSDEAYEAGWMLIAFSGVAIATQCLLIMRFIIMNLRKIFVKS